MIDILLVLLIVFMLLPVHSRGLESDLPQPGQPGAPAPNPQQVIVHIAKDGSLQIDTRPIVPAELEARLQSRLPRAPMASYSSTPRESSTSPMSPPSSIPREAPESAVLGC